MEFFFPISGGKPVVSTRYAPVSINTINLPFKTGIDMLLCESSIAALYTDFKHGGDKYRQVRDALERERLAVPPESEYAREIDCALRSLAEVFSHEPSFNQVLQGFMRHRA
jgi:hypothetical protein